MPCVRNATSSGGWHVESQTPIVLGGGANVECISSVWRPAGVDTGVVVDKSFCINWHDLSFVEVIQAGDLLIGSFSRITA
jgi:hypothetical protein